MDPVLLVQLRHCGDALEEEGDEGGVVRFGQLHEHPAKPFGVVGAQIGRRLHPGDDDRGVRVGGAGAVDDRLEVGARALEVVAAEGVVGAEGEDEDRDGLTEEPVDAAESAGRRLAAHAGVDHAERVPGLVDLPLDQRRVGLLGGEAVAGGERVAEEEDDGSVGLGRCSGARGRRWSGGRMAAGVGELRLVHRRCHGRAGGGIAGCVVAPARTVPVRRTAIA